MLLRNRSRAVPKPSLMGDHSSQPCPNQSYKRTIPSLFSPKFRNFTVTRLSGAESLPSPTSILDTRVLLSPSDKTVSHENNPETIVSTSPKVHSGNKTMWDSKCIGLALVGALKDKPNSGTVLFGTKLGVKQNCDAKTNDHQKYAKDSPLSVGTGLMSLSEMELSEEYTCVIEHGPYPRTTHIFDNCIVESYCSLPNTTPSPSLHFLSFCYTCKKHLEQTKDIFIYRGEKAFCSQECRHQEMVLDEAGTSEFDRYTN